MGLALRGFRFKCLRCSKDFPSVRALRKHDYFAWQEGAYQIMGASAGIERKEWYLKLG